MKTSWIGLAAGCLTTLSFIPQVIKIWKDRSAKDVSLLMFLIFSMGVLLWLVYGIRLGEPPIIIWNSITLALSSAVVYLKLKLGT